MLTISVVSTLTLSDASQRFRVKTVANHFEGLGNSLQKYVLSFQLDFLSWYSGVWCSTRKYGMV